MNNVAIIDGVTYEIGQRVKFHLSYSTNAHHRFRDGCLKASYPQDAKPLGYLGDALTQWGWVIGVRSAIMQCTRHYYGDAEDPGRREGKRETMLLIVTGIQRAPVLVRPRDILKDSPARENAAMGAE